MKTLPKITKSVLTEKVDTFYWFLQDITGGTPCENLKNAPFQLPRLEAKAALIAELATRQTKPALADSHLQERIANLPARVASYRLSYVLPQEPANILQFKR